MDTPRSEILSQLANGQITADQAAEQLRGQAAPQPGAAPFQPTPPQTPPPAPLTPEQAAALKNRWLRVRVSDLNSGRQRVSINLPLSVVSYGLRIGGRFSPEIAGLDADELLALLQSGANGQLVDVEDADSGEHVQVFIE